MPLYPVRCNHCGHETEILAATDKDLRCPKCDGDWLTRIFSAPNIHFKGTGFYVTDYAKKRKSNDG